MRIRTDDEVYRVDAVWLGPPKATFPWRARYVAWGVGTVVFLLVLTVLRNLGIGLFWSFAWGMVGTVALTMVICSRISHERPLGAVLTMWVRELTAPRETATGQGGAVTASAVRIRSEIPRRRDRQRTRRAAPPSGRAAMAPRDAQVAAPQDGRLAAPRDGRVDKKREKQRRRAEKARARSRAKRGNREVSGVRTP
ncbi:hypothetical protein [Actinokineospora spheciospongiae]|uniref:hypothetical protein n=1 Tax=Actinokineospora spheciospongiae TaxID=909613 RepID=UPI000D96224C|nr:hypothetical protein [Actinokineospora spheciospongiae]PWW65275.1 hypothetical protein DFQ13_10224 [Actinokineospora spheciospongiae]